MPTTMHQYNIQTGEYLYSRLAQVVNGKEITVSSSATTVALPADIPAGRKARWTGAAWEIVEDHRQHMDETGTKVGGTPYWLPGDTHTSPARYTDKLGPLPEGALLEKPAAPPPTPKELEEKFDQATGERLDAFAALKEYTKGIAAAIAVTGGSADFQADHAVLQNAYDATWTKYIELVPKVRSGELTVEQAVAQLPALVWPE
jgi:hypothetical protein